MKKRLTLIGMSVLLAVVMLVVGITAFAADGEFTRDVTVSGLTVTVGGKTVSGVYSDPVDYWEQAGAGVLINYEIRYDGVGNDDSVIYTAYYPDTTTGRVGNVDEYTCEYVDGKYVVTKINTAGDGTTYIPVGGFVLSVNSEKNASLAKVGDVVSVDGNLRIPTRAVESASGKRVVVDNTNSNRSEPMVVYYDYQFGAKTGTNVFGTEMTCEYDFDKNTFVVTDFRDFLEGDDSGSEIPDNSFVLSAYGEGFRQLLLENELFEVGDEVKMVGFDFVRFGGTIYGNYDLVNPTKETNYPYCMETATEEFAAFRGENQTMIYKDGWDYKGAAGTGTNVYGYEAAVDASGVIVELGVNVSKIPEGGYVISGHGKGRDFIRSNAVLGATVVLDEENKTYAISTTLNSYYENLVLGVEADVNTAEKRIQQLYDVDSELLNELIAEVRVELEGLKTVKEDIETALDDPDLTETERLSLLMRYNDGQLKIEKLRQKIVISSADSKVVSARAVWHRPIETTYAELETNMKMYHDIGINLIFVETLYNGYSAFKSEHEEFPYHKNLAASYTANDGTVYEDYLSAFLALAAKYDIEVHSWVENFYVGIDQNAAILTLHPDWVMYNDDNTVVQRNEGGPYYFVDPANKEVQDLLIAYYNELLDKHPEVAGLNLDYIRYPVSSLDEDTGYTMAAMKGFYDSLGLEFKENQLADRVKMRNKFVQLFDPDYLYGGQDEADENYEKWVMYRMGLITGYVERIKNEVKLPNNIMLSTSVFASIQESYYNKKQDWKTWFNNGWIDIATPMAYYNNTVDVNKNVQNMILMGGNNCMYYTGLASSYSGLPAWQNKEFVEASYSAGAAGYVIFCSTQIIGHEDVQAALMSGVNSKWAVLPHAAINEILEAAFGDILDKADRLYIPAGGMTEEQKASLKAVLDEILAMDSATARDIYNIESRIKALADKDVKDYAKGYSRQRIIEDLEYLVEILDARVSMQLIEDEEWDPEKDSQRPDFDGDDNEPETPVEPGDPTDPDDPIEEPKLNFFQRIWQAIVNFFKKLFGKKD